MKLWKYSGTFLVITGTLHVIIGISVNGRLYLEMLKSGLVNISSKDYATGFAFWFFMIGILLVLWGTTLQHYIKKEQKPAPLFLGYAMSVFAFIGCLMNPVSGFWLFIPQALIIIAANKYKKIIL